MYLTFHNYVPFLKSKHSKGSSEKDLQIISLPSLPGVDQIPQSNQSGTMASGFSDCSMLQK